MSAREEILGRIHAALRDSPGAPSVPREYRLTGEHPRGSAEAVALLVSRLEGHRARVHRVPGSGIEAALDMLLGEDTSVVLPAGAPRAWLAASSARGRTVRIDGGDQPPLATSELDRIDAVVTGCWVAIAETGTIVLDAGADQGRRAITLVPDHHICVVRPEQVVSSVPEALAVVDPTRPLTFISGPSATSDIELRRVEGVHGPRKLDVVIVEAP